MDINTNNQDKDNTMTNAQIKEAAESRMRDIIRMAADHMIDENRWLDDEAPEGTSADEIAIAKMMNDNFQAAVHGINLVAHKFECTK